jgi:hypothetical protein
MNNKIGPTFAALYVKLAAVPITPLILDMLTILPLVCRMYGSAYWKESSIFLPTRPQRKPKHITVPHPASLYDSMCNITHVNPNQFLLLLLLLHHHLLLLPLLVFNSSKPKYYSTYFQIGPFLPLQEEDSIIYFQCNFFHTLYEYVNAQNQSIQ